MEFKNSIEKECNERVKRKDSWGEEVKVRISVVNDLHASDALYHEKCRKLFFNGGNSPIEKKTSKAGRPEDSKKIIAFHEVCKYLEDSEECQFSLTELEDYMISVWLGIPSFPLQRPCLQHQFIFLILYLVNVPLAVLRGAKGQSCANALELDPDDL